MSWAPSSKSRTVDFDGSIARQLVIIVTGKGSIAGKAIALHMDIEMLTFTGSGPVGRMLMFGWALAAGIGAIFRAPLAGALFAVDTDAAGLPANLFGAGA